MAALNGAHPVPMTTNIKATPSHKQSPGPIIITGMLGSTGNTKVPGITQTGTLVPGCNDASQVEHTPYTIHITLVSVLIH